ncbi:hypothetical protein HAX54_042990 [Datura stramonium]|uniref:Uncharacterized protein n=1 Tax=Datura stramonium TaxID=4076 RepID=A0ABS8W1Q8_DATST|nr:hypothetical protein [Datura stramonium]
MNTDSIEAGEAIRLGAKPQKGLRIRQPNNTIFPTKDQRTRQHMDHLSKRRSIYPTVPSQLWNLETYPKGSLQYGLRDEPSSKRIVRQLKNRLELSRMRFLKYDASDCQHSEFKWINHDHSWSLWSQGDPYGYQDYYGGYSPSHLYYSNHEGNLMHDEEMAYECSRFDEERMPNEYDQDPFFQPSSSQDCWESHP